MSGGFGAGFVKGALVSLLAAGAVSVALPLPSADPGKTSQVDLSTPAGSGFNAARKDTNPVLPDTDQSVVTEDVKKPEVVVTSPKAPAPDTSSPSVPTALGQVAPPPAAPAVQDQVAMVTPPKVETKTTPPVVKAPPALGVPMPEIDNPVAQIPAEAPVVSATQTAEAATPPTLPNVGDANNAPAAETVISAPVINGVSEGSTAALMRNKVPFENPKGRPLMSIILIDAGEDGLDAELLSTFTFPVTFALDPDAKSATAMAKSYAAKGFEVLALAPSQAHKLSPAENAADVETALNGAFAALPEAVGLIDAPAAEIQSSKKLSNQVIMALGKTGHGLVTYDIGLNTVDKTARRSGLKSDVVYRVLDAERESGTVIKRYLDRAALEAGKVGQIIVLGRTYPETVTALFSWGLSAKAATVALAPVSASLLAH